MDGIGFAEVGVVGIICVFLIREVFGYIRARNGGGTNKSARLIQDLWDWHKKEDDEGVKIWYVRRSLEAAVTKLAKVLTEQTEVLQKQGTLLEHLCQRTDEIRDSVRKG